MKQLAIFMLLLSALAITPVHQTSALEPVIANNKIKVTGIVPARHTVVLDQNSQIIRIISNTDQSANPTFYYQTTDNQVSANEQLQQQYDTIMSVTALKQGVIYSAL